MKYKKTMINIVFFCENSIIFLLLAKIIVLFVTETVSVILSFISMVIFTFFIGHDLQKAQTVPKTTKNAIIFAGKICLAIIMI